MEHAEKEPLESMHSKDLLSYFGYENNKNAGLVTWAHAVNSQKDFEEAKQSQINFFEADILISANDNIPIMAHPPFNESDLTLNDFLTKAASMHIGIKLDFKTLEALQGSVSILRQHSASVSEQPVWMNADIVGHGTVPRGKVDPDEFLRISSEVTPKATLSLGWNINTPYFRSINDPAQLGYHMDDVKRMTDALRRNNVTQPVTFAVWSRFTKNSGESLKWLLDQHEDSTFTIWGSEGEASVEDVASIYEFVPNSRIFLDLPESVRRNLNVLK